MGRLRSCVPTDIYRDADTMNRMNLACRSLWYIGAVVVMLWTIGAASVNTMTDVRSTHAYSSEIAPLLPACPNPSSYGEIIPSPLYDQDHTLFFRYSQGSVLWSTADDGHCWRRVYEAPQPSGRISQLSIPLVAGSSALWLYVVYAYDFPDPRTTKMIVRSTDGGNTWQLRSSCDPNCITVVTTDWPETIFAGRSEPYYVFEPGKGVLRSDDGGLTWETQWNQASIWGIHVSPAFVDDRTIFVRTWSWHEPPVSWLIASTDGGNTWTPRDSGLDGSPVEELAFSPGFAQDHELFATIGRTLFRSENAGLTWGSVVVLSDDSIMDFAVSPNYPEDHTFFMATHEEVMVSYNGGNNWNVLIPERFLYNLTITGRSASGMHSTLTVSIPTTMESESPRLFLPLVGGMGLRPLPLTLFLSATVPGQQTTFYRSENGGLTWRCLPLPPVEN